MNQEYDLDDSKVIAWRIDNYETRLADARESDQWRSPPYKIDHTKLGPVPFELIFYPKEVEKTGDQTQEIGRLALHLRNNRRLLVSEMICMAWVQDVAGRRTDPEPQGLEYDSLGILGWQLLIGEQREKFSDSSMIFVCVNFPYNVETTGIISDRVTKPRWTVSGLPHQLAVGDYTTSKKFVIEGLEDLKFWIGFDPKDNKKDVDSCGLCLHCSGHFPVHVQFEFWIENDAEERTYKETKNHLFDGINEKGVDSYINHTEMREFAAKTPLVVCCNLRVIDEVVKPGPKPVFSSQVARLFNVPEFSNLQVRGNRVVFKVNNLILGTHSSVFRAMFSQASRERDTAIIRITDIDDYLLETMLRYMYSGEVDGLTEIAPQLLPVADRYDLAPLIEMCTKSIIDNLNLDHIFRDLELAFRHAHMVTFKRRVVCFAHKNCQKMLESPEIGKFAAEHPEVLMELLEIAHL